jgi:ribonuclease P protein subunit RPR2
MGRSSIKEIARKRVQTLFEQAKLVSRNNPQLAIRYVESARKIAMAARIRLPAGFKRDTCKECNTLFVQGYSCRVRVKQKREPHVVVTCLNCGNQTRLLLSKKKGFKEFEQDNY